jgi:uncharacterized membrane protein
MAEAVNTTNPPEQSDRDCGCRGPSRTSAREILDRRYARGEVTREPYEQMKQDLGGDTKSNKSKKGCC